MTLSALWRRLDEPGHDIAQLRQAEDGWLLSGTTVYLSRAGPSRLDYTVQLAADWTSISGTVRGFVGPQEVDATVRRTGNDWTLNGRPQPQTRSMLDLDYGFTPATNLQQLRRLRLEVGESADLPVAWLAAGADGLTVLPQTYRRLGETDYAYEAPTVPYRATLRISEAGFAQDYPGGWVLERRAADDRT
jgi:hypothetical protein